MTLDQVLAITGPLAEAAEWVARLLVLAGVLLLGHLLRREAVERERLQSRLDQIEQPKENRPYGRP